MNVDQRNERDAALVRDPRIDVIRIHPEEQVRLLKI
jgi:hypothetical protein